MTFKFEKQKARFWDEYKGKTIELDKAFNEHYRQYKLESECLGESIAWFNEDEQSERQTEK